MHLLGGEQWEAVGKIEAHLIAKYAFRACACAVALEGAVVKHMLHQIEILFHDFCFVFLRCSCANLLINNLLFAIFSSRNIIFAIIIILQLFTMKYWVNIDGIQHGPLSHAELAKLEFDPEVTYVWHNGLDDWQKISDVEELAGIVAAAAKHHCTATPAPEPVAEEEIASTQPAEQESTPEPEATPTQEPAQTPMPDVEPEPADEPEPAQQAVPEAEATQMPQPPELPTENAHVVTPLPIYYRAPTEFYGAPMPPQQEGSPQPTYLVWSILVLVLCCQITGIVALVYSALTSSNNSNGNYDQARRYSENAQLWIMISIAIGLITAPFAILYYLFI